MFHLLITHQDQDRNQSIPFYRYSDAVRFARYRVAVIRYSCAVSQKWKCQILHHRVPWPAGCTSVILYDHKDPVQAFYPDDLIPDYRKLKSVPRTLCNTLWIYITPNLSNFLLHQHE